MSAIFNTPDNTATDRLRLRRMLDSNAGVVERTWGMQMFGPGGAMELLHTFMEDRKLTPDQALVELDTKYAMGTYHNDVRIWELRDRHVDEFREVLQGGVTNTEARRMFLQLQRKDFQDLQAVMRPYIKEQLGGKGNVRPAAIAAAVEYVKEKLHPLTAKERKSLTSWVKQGKVNRQAGSGIKPKAAKINFKDPATLMRAMMTMAEVLSEQLDIDVDYKALVRDTDGAGLTNALRRKLYPDEEEAEEL